VIDAVAEPTQSSVNKSGMTIAPTAEISTDKIWAKTQGTLRSILHPELYQMWFATLRAVSFESEVLTLEAANDFSQLWLQDNYAGLIHDVVLQVLGRSISVQFVARVDVGGAEPLSDVPPAAAVAEPEVRVTGSYAATIHREFFFNPRNTFDTFVVGGTNEHAHAAALAVAREPGKSYNPVFFHGGVGLGKTHLLHAIGQYVATTKRNAKVSYLTSEKFTNEFIDAIQNNSLAKFRKKYRQTDVLLIDDIQFLAGKERIQEEFFHTFNALHESHKQIVIAGDRPINEMQNLEQRLVSRFEWGLVAELMLPELETRLAILRKKSALLNLNVPDDVLTFIGTRIRSNIRRLEGALVRVGSVPKLTGKALTIEVAQDYLRDILQEEGKQVVTIEVIQKRVAEHFDLRVADMTGKRRPEHIVFPRQIAMYLSRQLTEGSLNTIGEAFGGRDHGTVLHACRSVKDRMEIESNVRQVVGYLEKQLMR
jgi:chromosomal replication initiator protein